MNNEKLNVSADTIARTAILFLALVNQILAILGEGQISFVEDDLYQLVSVLFTVVTTVWAWWKNNSFTQSALKADEALKKFKGAE